MTCLELSTCGKSGLVLMSLGFQSVASSVFLEAGEYPVHNELSSQCVGAGVRGGGMPLAFSTLCKVGSIVLAGLVLVSVTGQVCLREAIAIRERAKCQRVPGVDGHCYIVRYVCSCLSVYT